MQGLRPNVKWTPLFQLFGNYSTFYDGKELTIDEVTEMAINFEQKLQYSKPAHYPATALQVHTQRGNRGRGGRFRQAIFTPDLNVILQSIPGYFGPWCTLPVSK